MKNNVISLKSYEIIYLSKKSNRLNKLFNLIGNLEYKTYDDSYVFLVNTIIGQMLSNKVADVIQNRLFDLCNGNLTPENIIKFSIEDFRKIGISYSKINYIFNLSNAVINNQIRFDDLENKSNEEVCMNLEKIKGIGKWSSKMYLIFVLNRKNVLPLEDIAFIQGYKWLYNTQKVDKESILKNCRSWEPYSSIVARYLYYALDMGYTKIKFSEYKNKE